MADELLRRYLSQAFDPGPDFPNRLLLSRTMATLASVSQEPRRRTRMSPALPRAAWRLMAAALVLLMVVGAFGVFLAVRNHTRPYTVSPPVPSASPNPVVPRPSAALTQPLNVDKSTPVILFNDAGDNFQVDGMTWNGQSGKLTQVPNGGHYPHNGEASNPAGTLFVASPNILDRSGRVVATLPDRSLDDLGMGSVFFGTWADDGYHYCQVTPLVAQGNPVPAKLQLTTPGGKPRDVAQSGTQGPSGMTLTVTACSVLADRAVLVHREMDFIQYWVVQLSNGRVLWTHTVNSTCPPPIPTVSGCGLPNVVASRDGRYVAEVPMTNFSFLYRPDGSKAEVLPIGPSTIYGPNGSPVGNVDGSVWAFSWDGSLALVMASHAGRARMSVVRWIDGTVIWTGPDGKLIWGFQSEPGGTSLAILTTDPHGYGSPSSGVLYVVSSGGRVLAQVEVGGGPNGGLLACRPRCVGAAW